MRPLEGTVVLDYTIFQAGPVATMMLWDMGADVIKIEDVDGGDPARNSMNVWTNAGRNARFEFANRGKRSVTLDLRKAEGRQILHQLIAKADVFVHNRRREYMRKYELNYDSLGAHNPRLIYASASGWGPNGPDANQPAMDYTAQARAGLFFIGEDNMPPSYVWGSAFGDQMCGIMTAYGILGALHGRERLGVGQELDASLLSSLMWLQSLAFAHLLLDGEETAHPPRTHSRNPLWNHYRCGDGRWVALANSQADKFWPSFCTATGQNHLRDDSRFATIQARVTNCEELIRILDGVFATKPQEEWLRLCREHDVIAAPVNRLSDVVRDPQVLANKYVSDYDHPSHGQTRLVANPVQYSKTPLRFGGPAPELGQHTEEVLTELLGLDWDQIVSLRDRKVI